MQSTKEKFLDKLREKFTWDTSVNKGSTEFLDAIIARASSAYDETHGEKVESSHELDDFEFNIIDPDTKSTVIIKQAKEVHIHNSKNTVNNGPITNNLKPKSKLEQIESNLNQIITSGIMFNRMTTYHIKATDANGEQWNFYLSGKEAFHRDGQPTEGYGVDNFIATVKKNENT